jgi:tRNA(Ile)-lysidine synthase
MIARVRRTLLDRGLIAPGMRVLAACSGGPDSGAMLVALRRLSSELGFSLEAASVDHGLREGAKVDLATARAQAAAAGVPFHALQVSVPGSASLQAEARAARYGALLGLAAHIGAARIAVGHTRDDQAETVMLRILRGSGLLGLRGIDPSRPDGVIRPLIDCRRAEVAAFAQRHCPEIASDPSNVDQRFGRSRVRADVLPLLEREDPAIVEHLADLAEEARALSAALRPNAEALLALSIQANDIIDVSTWASSPASIRRLALRIWLERATGEALRRSHLAAVDRATSAPGEIWLSAGWVVRSAGNGRLQLARSRLAR